MVDIGRLSRLTLWFVVGVLLSAWSVFANAETTPATLGTGAIPRSAAGTCWVGGNMAASINGMTLAACAAHANGMITANPGAYVTATTLHAAASATSTETTKLTYWNGNSGGWFVTYRVALNCPAGSTFNATTAQCEGPVYSCPVGQNWTLSGTQCTRPDCAVGETRNPATGICSAPDCALQANAQIGTGRYATAYPPVSGQTYCLNGCNAYAAGSGTVQGNTRYMYMYVNGAGGAASNCTVGTATPAPDTTAPDGTPVADPTAASCIAAGKGFGTVNNVVVCTGKADSTAQTTVSKTVNPAGTATTSTTTNTVCTGAGSCTTTSTTSTTSGGSGPGGTGPGSTTTPGDDQTTVGDDAKPKAFCVENPDSLICKQGSFSGTCGAAPSCDGDAVQCAQAAAAWKIQCNMETEPNDSAYLLGKTIAGGGADTSPNPLDPANIDTIDIGSIISTAGNNRTLTASCIPSPSFSVMGNSYTMDTTILCQFAEIVGFLMVAASAVISVRIVTAGGS